MHVIHWYRYVFQRTHLPNTVCLLSKCLAERYVMKLQWSNKNHHLHAQISYFTQLITSPSVCFPLTTWKLPLRGRWHEHVTQFLDSMNHVRSMPITVVLWVNNNCTTLRVLVTSYYDSLQNIKSTYSIRYEFCNNYASILTNTLLRFALTIEIC